MTSLPEKIFVFCSTFDKSAPWNWGRRGCTDVEAFDDADGVEEEAAEAEYTEAEAPVFLFFLPLVKAPVGVANIKDYTINALIYRKKFLLTTHPDRITFNRSSVIRYSFPKQSTER